MMREQVFWDNQKYTLKDKPGTDLKNSAKLVKDWCNYWKLVSGSRSALSEKCDERMGFRRLHKWRRFEGWCAAENLANSGCVMNEVVPANYAKDSPYKEYENM